MNDKSSVRMTNFWRSFIIGVRWGLTFTLLLLIWKHAYWGVAFSLSMIFIALELMTWRRD